MGRLYRPHIPLAVRLRVAERMLGVFLPNETFARIANRESFYELRKGEMVLVRYTLQNQLDFALTSLAYDLRCDVKDLRLDHDPALCNRPQKRRGSGPVLYTPDANDPNHLVYRTKADHDIKTRIRGDGAQHSDLALRRIAKKRAAKRGKLSTNRLAKSPKRRNKKAWPKRPFAGSRGFPKKEG